MRPEIMDDRLTTDIDQRAGWPNELKSLLERFPRDTWRSQGNSMTQFWLDKHGYFRQQCQALEQLSDDYREQRTSPAEFANMIAPRLQSFLMALQGHHQIEDYHYFPAFRTSHATLASGFDVLASDHELLHQGIVDIVEKTNALIDTLRPGSVSTPGDQRRAGDGYVDTAAVTYRRLVRHLEDEEDLIIPIMLDQ